MTKQILFIQGAGEGTHDHWDNKLVAGLERELGDEYVIRYPRMPGAGNPKYTVWRATLAEELVRLEKGAILVGHSFGGTVLFRTLSEQQAPAAFGGLFLLAAPFIGKGGREMDNIADRKNMTVCLPADLPVYLYHGTGDEVVPVAHVHLYAKAMPGAAVRLLEGKDHQLDGDMRDVARDIRLLG